MTTNYHPYEHLFRPFEQPLQQIISAYPTPQRISCLGRSASTVRQNLRRALRLFVSSPSLSSVIPHDRACLVERECVFSDNLDGTIYVGPKRSRNASNAYQIASESQPTTLTLPTIDCTDPTTLAAVLHLKNFDHLPVPVTITTPPIPDTLLTNYPNVELISNPDGSCTVL